jgi:hypothetical protein
MGYSIQIRTAGSLVIPEDSGYDPPHPQLPEYIRFSPRDMTTVTLKGTWKNGQVILDNQADWPDGCRVVVTRECAPDPPGTTEDEQADDPESITRWLAVFDAIPPVISKSRNEMSSSSVFSVARGRNAPRFASSWVAVCCRKR